MSCADVEIALKYLTTFVVTSVCQLLRRTLYPGVFVIDDIGVSSDAFSFDGWHLKYCIAHEKGCVLQQGNSKGFRPYLQYFSVSANSLNSLVRKRAQTMHLDVVISLYRSVYVHTSSGNRIAFFLLHRFFPHSCKRNDREDTHVHYVFSLSVFVVAFVERTVSRQSHSVSARLGWRKPRWFDSRSSSNFECRRADSDRYGTLDFRQISWNAARITLICITQSSPFTLRFAQTMVVVFIHDVYRNYFTKESSLAIISLKVVSHRSVFVTFDLIIVTKILEHKTNEIDDAEEKWDKTPKRDREIASKLYVQSSVLRHQSRSFKKKGVVTLRTTRQIIFIELFDRNSTRRSGGRLPSIHRELFCVQLIMRFSFLSFFHYRNNIYLYLQQITSFWLLSRDLRPSNFVDLCQRIWNRKKNCDLDMFFFICSKFLVKKKKSLIQPNEMNK